MQDQSKFSPGFIPLEDAFKLIDKDTRENAVVDIQFMMENIFFIESKHNFQIPLLGKNNEGKLVRKDIVYVYIEDEAARYSLRKKIQEHYEKLSGRKVNVNGIGLRRTSTMVDEQYKNMGGRVMANPESSIGYMDDIKTGVEA